MHEAVSPVAETFGRDPSSTSVLVADGYGIQLRVERGHLVVQDGIGRHRRERRFARATHGRRRVVVLGHTGYITFDAQRWMADVGIDYVHLERTRSVVGLAAQTRQWPSRWNPRRRLERFPPLPSRHRAEVSFACTAGVVANSPRCL